MSVSMSGLSLFSEQRGLSVDGRFGVSYKWDEGYAVLMARRWHRIAAVRGRFACTGRLLEIDIIMDGS